MKTCCLSCRKHPDNIGSKKVIRTNKVVREKSTCANCMVDKSRFLIQKSNKKSNKKLVKTKLTLNYSYIKQNSL